MHKFVYDGNGKDADGFETFCQNYMTVEMCEKAEKVFNLPVKRIQQRFMKRWKWRTCSKSGKWGKLDNQPEQDIDIEVQPEQAENVVVQRTDPLQRMQEIADAAISAIDLKYIQREEILFDQK